MHMLKELIELHQTNYKSISYAHKHTVYANADIPIIFESLVQNSYLHK